MDNLENVIAKLKSMSKSERKNLLSEISRDPDAMKQVSSFLEKPEIVKKLNDLLK